MRSIGILTLMLFFISCKKTILTTINDSDGLLFVMSNESDTNRIIVYNRAEDGSLNFKKIINSGGTGIGSRLGSQGGICLSKDGQWLFSVNGGSNSISSFSIIGNEIKLVNTVSSRGIKPVSISSFGNLVAVVNAGGNGSLSVFQRDENGNLLPIQNSVLDLGTSPTLPGQVCFTKDGTMLVITLKQAAKILAFNVNQNGALGSQFELSSNAPVPYGFALSSTNNIYVSEAGANAVSVYHIGTNGISTVSGPFYPLQNGPCWLTALPNDSYFYVANAGSSNISGFKVNSDTTFTILNNGIAGESGLTPIDIVSSPDSRFVYTLNAQSKSVRTYKVNADGLLSVESDHYGLPASCTSITIK